MYYNISKAQEIAGNSSDTDVFKSYFFAKNDFIAFLLDSMTPF